MRSGFTLKAAFLGGEWRHSTSVHGRKEFEKSVNVDTSQERSRRIRIIRQLRESRPAPSGARRTCTYNDHAFKAVCILEQKIVDLTNRSYRWWEYSLFKDWQVSQGYSWKRGCNFRFHAVKSLFTELGLQASIEILYRRCSVETEYGKC